MSKREQYDEISLEFSIVEEIETVQEYGNCRDEVCVDKRIYLDGEDVYNMPPVEFKRFILEKLGL